MNFEAFDSFEEMIKQLQSNNELGKRFVDANRIEPDHLMEGYWKLEGDIVIYGKAEEGLVPFEQYDSQEEYEYEKNGLAEARNNGYIFGRWYSIWCEGGELGSNHVSRCVPITEEEFNAAKERNWVDENECPRCGHGIPSDAHRGEYIGALSRRDNKTYICSKCGNLEAFEDMGVIEYDGPVYWKEKDVDS